jgi:superfamily II DNA/RNA helicase
VHGDLGQGAREQAMRAFRSGKVDILVATDVAARGLDVEGVTHVINYQCPEDEKVYLHRIGRTGRAGASGVAVTFVDWDELARWKMICDALGLPLHEAPETYSTSEHLFVDLDIPTEATGRLPRAQRTRAGLDAEEVEDLGETGAHAGSRRRSRSRSRSEGGSASAPGSAPGSAPDGEAAESRPRRSRTRRRTRGGQPVDGAAVEVVSGDAGDAATAAELAGAVATVEADLSGAVATVEADPAGVESGPGSGTGEGQRRRRRRRGGRGRGAKPEATDESVAESA